MLSSYTTILPFFVKFIIIKVLAVILYKKNTKKIAPVWNLEKLLWLFNHFQVKPH